MNDNYGNFRKNSDYSYKVLRHFQLPCRYLKRFWHLSWKNVWYQLGYAPFLHSIMLDGEECMVNIFWSSVTGEEQTCLNSVFFVQDCSTGSVPPSNRGYWSYQWQYKITLLMQKYQYSIMKFAGGIQTPTPNSVL